MYPFFCPLVYVHVWYMNDNFSGFTLSDVEPTALIQHEGGPCAVIAPVQGFLLRRVLFESEFNSQDLNKVSGKNRESWLTGILLWRAKIGWDAPIPKVARPADASQFAPYAPVKSVLTDTGYSYMYIAPLAFTVFNSLFLCPRPERSAGDI